MKNYSVIIPVFRATEENLVSLISGINELHLGEGVELIFVFDGGQDKSKIALRKVVEKYSNTKAVFLSKNFGQHNAIICGIDHAEGDLIITMDEDLQHSPESIPALLKKQKEADYDLVYGKYEERMHSFFRNTTSLLLKYTLKIGIPNLHPDFTSFRIIKADVAKKMVNMHNSYTFLDGYLSWLTDHVASVEVAHAESKSGKSSYSLRRLVEHSINIFITFSNLPIRVLSIASFGFIFLSFSYSLYIVISALTVKNYDPGFPTFVAFLGFGFGFVLFGLGVIGEYIARINYKTTRRPNYNISETIPNDSIQ